MINSSRINIKTLLNNLFLEVYKLQKVLDFVAKQDTFIRIGFYVGASFIILLMGYLVGGFIGRMTG
jgi:hypothetical protein